MDKETVISNIDRLIEIFRIREKLFNIFNQVFNLEDDFGAWYEDVFCYPVSMVWDMIISSRGFPETDEEFDTFNKLIWEKVNNETSICEIKDKNGKIKYYPINNSEDIYDFFTWKTSLIIDFYKKIIYNIYRK